MAESARSRALTIPRAGDTNTEAMVNFVTADGTAIDGLNSTAVSGMLALRAGETNKVIAVPILNDGLIGGIKTFRRMPGSDQSKVLSARRIVSMGSGKRRLSRAFLPKKVVSNDDPNVDRRVLETTAMDAALWFDIENEKLATEREDAEWSSVRNGTVQHEIFEGECASVFAEDETIVIRVSCRSDANSWEGTVRYGLVVSVEVAEELRVPVYDEIATRPRSGRC